MNLQPTEPNTVDTEFAYPPGAVHDIFKRPSHFLRDSLDINLWAKQSEILSALRNNRRIAVRSCNCSGKTFAAACAVIWWLMAFNDSAVVITTAPTERQVKELLWREIRSIHARHATRIGGTITQTGLDISPSRYARGFSTDLPDRFQGFHDPNILFIVDEASGVDEDIFQAIEGSMATAGSRLLVLGNPRHRKGTFFNAFSSRSSLWHNIHISAFDTPNLQPGRTTLSPGLVTKEWVEEAARLWGTDSPEYKMRVLGEFPPEAPGSTIPRQLVETAMERRNATTTDPSEPTETEESA